MASRRKEDEKNELIVRGLLKLPGNRCCMNCGSLGPQYACINFATFICSFCSGIHREFSHRIKSVSMATFTASEVTALQAGGNNRAREIYLRYWESPSKLPPSNDSDKIRDFIKVVFEQRRYTGEKRESPPAPEQNLHSHRQFRGTEARSRDPAAASERRKEQPLPKELEISEKAANVLKQLLQPPVARSPSSNTGLKTSKSMIISSSSTRSPAFERSNSTLERISTADKESRSPRKAPVTKSASPAVKKSNSASLLDLLTDAPENDAAPRKQQDGSIPKTSASDAPPTRPAPDLIDFSDLGAAQNSAPSATSNAVDLLLPQTSTNPQPDNFGGLNNLGDLQTSYMDDSKAMLGTGQAAVTVPQPAAPPSQVGAPPLVASFQQMTMTEASFSPAYPGKALPQSFQTEASFSPAYPGKALPQSFQVPYLDQGAQSNGYFQQGPYLHQGQHFQQQGHHFQPQQQQGQYFQQQQQAQYFQQQQQQQGQYFQQQGQYMQQGGSSFLPLPPFFTGDVVQPVLAPVNPMMVPYQHHATKSQKTNNPFDV